jgi:hypothetical protein
MTPALIPKLSPRLLVNKRKWPHHSALQGFVVRYVGFEHQLPRWLGGIKLLSQFVSVLLEHGLVRRAICQLNFSASMPSQ